MLSAEEVKMLELLYSRRRGVTALFAAKLTGLDLARAKMTLERLRAMRLVVKRSKFYARVPGLRYRSALRRLKMAEAGLLA
ncbi:MAG: hypothetical protein DRJ97_02070 [Thermoprotei archaeon]|nr:MAG: hypothetical protein DRJ97_02070 [Thermoprotei archaeon]